MQSGGLVVWAGKVCAGGVCWLVSRVPEGMQADGLVVWSPVGV